jgi:hypothetical protein
MLERTATFASGDQTAGRHAHRPSRAPGPFPAVLLLPGSGPIDRTPTTSACRWASPRSSPRPSTRPDSRPSATTSAALAESTGRWHSAGFYDNRDDAAAALEFLLGTP